MKGRPSEEVGREGRDLAPKILIILFLSLMIIPLLMSANVNAVSGVISNSRITVNGNVGDIIEKSLVIKNINNGPVVIEMTTSSNSNDYIILKDNMFTLEPGENRTVFFDVGLRDAGTKEEQIIVKFTADVGQSVALTSTLIINGNILPNTDARLSSQLITPGNEVKAGNKVVIKSTITNTGQQTTSYAISAQDYRGFSTIESITPATVSISAGSSADVLITLKLNDDVSGDQSFTIIATFGSKSVTQAVSLSVSENSITGNAIESTSQGTTCYYKLNGACKTRFYSGSTIPCSQMGTPVGFYSGMPLYSSLSDCTNGIECTNECGTMGAKDCSENLKNECGQFDSDVCLDVRTTDCSLSGQVCSNGECITQNNQTNNSITLRLQSDSNSGGGNNNLLLISLIVLGVILIIVIIMLGLFLIRGGLSKTKNG